MIHSKQDNKQEKQIDLGHYIVKLFKHGRSFMDYRMENLEIGSGQFGFLFFLYEHNGVSQDEMCKSLEVDKATVARSIQKLEKKGFVTRQINEKDKRINNVYLTEKAYKVKEEILLLKVQWRDILTSGLTQSELVTLEALLNRLLMNSTEYKKSIGKKEELNDK